jgi:molybdopterin molybdotransferase
VLSVADAARRVIERVPRLTAEPVSLDASVGRILAADAIATRALPGFDNSAMDGYALRAADVPGSLLVVGEVAAGAVRTEPVPPRSCVRIFTGAPLPSDLDTVVMQEDVTREGDLVTFPSAPVGDNVRRAGEDVAIGDVVLTAGTRITPWHVGLLAALGFARVDVVRAPRVAIIATGDELVDVDAAPGPGQLVASSSHALAALIRECGGEPHVLGIARDDIDAIRAMVARALGTSTSATTSSRTGASTTSAITGSQAGPSSSSDAFDAVITTGGVSVGDHDHVHAALAAAGVTRELYKVAMKPGKPFAFGTYSRAAKTEAAETGHGPQAATRETGDRLQGEARETGDRLQGAAHETGDRLQGAAHETGDRLQGAAHETGDRLQGAAHETGDWSQSSTPVFGLPGNPVSTVVAFELFVRPALLAMQGATIVDRPRARVHLASAYRKQAGRAHYLRAIVTRESHPTAAASMGAASSSPTMTAASMGAASSSPTMAASSMGAASSSPTMAASSMAAAASSPTMAASSMAASSMAASSMAASSMAASSMAASSMAASSMAASSMAASSMVASSSTPSMAADRLVARAHAKQGSAMLSSLVGPNALVEIPADATEVAEGSLVTAILLEAV